MNITKVRVDFNRRGPNGQVMASDRGAASPLVVGESVIAYQPGEDMEFYATVVSRDEVRGVSGLKVDWGSEPGRSLSADAALALWGADPRYFARPQAEVSTGATQASSEHTPANTLRPPVPAGRG